MSLHYRMEPKQTSNRNGMRRGQIIPFIDEDTIKALGYLL